MMLLVIIFYYLYKGLFKYSSLKTDTAYLQPQASKQRVDHTYMSANTCYIMILRKRMTFHLVT